MGRALATRSLSLNTFVHTLRKVQGKLIQVIKESSRLFNNIKNCTKFCGLIHSNKLDLQFSGPNQSLTSTLEGILNGYFGSINRKSPHHKMTVHSALPLERHLLISVLHAYSCYNWGSMIHFSSIKH